MQPPQLDTHDDYISRFADAIYWQPYVEHVCARHQLSPSHPIRCHNPGTYPTFIVAEQWVIKFFGTLFNGAATFAAEYEANQLIAAQASVESDARAPLPAPPLLGHGFLLDESAPWRWPYLMIKFIPDVVSFGEVFEQVSPQDKVATARQLGRLARQIHTLRLDNAKHLRPSWAAYTSMLDGLRSTCQARHDQWRTLPPHLIDQIETFLAAQSDLVDLSTRPCLLHGDMTGDHVLGTLAEGHWRMRNLIDFGDAIVGDPAYDLIPLQLDCFWCDTRLLDAYLDTYGCAALNRPELSRKCLSLALLHQFNVFVCVASHKPSLLELPTLEALAGALFGQSPASHL